MNTLREWLKGFIETRTMEFPMDAGFLKIRDGVQADLKDGEYVLRKELRDDKQVLVIGTRCDSKPTDQPSA